MTSDPIIRQASSKDVPTILSFIRAGSQEQSPSAKIATTEERLLNTLCLTDLPPLDASGKLPRVAHTLLAFSPSDNKPVGMLVYFFNYATWSAGLGICVEELYVAPEYRGVQHGEGGKGYARLLFEAVAKEAERVGCVKMDWVCLKDNEKALRFYEKIGAARMEDWVVLKVGGKDIERIARGD